MEEVQVPPPGLQVVDLAQSVDLSVVDLTRPEARPPGALAYSLRVLTPDEEADVEEVLSEHAGLSSEYLAHSGRVSVTRGDIWSLNPGQFLNDKLIDFFMNLLGTREAFKPSELPQCHFMSCHFYDVLTVRGYRRVRRCTARTDIFGKAFVTVPIFCSVRFCWSLAVVNIGQRRFEYYTIWRHPDRERTIFLNLRQWLEEEYKDKNSGAVYDTSAWSDVVWTHDSLKDISCQDSGIFITRIADYLSRGAWLDFTAVNMKYYRRRMVIEILRTALLM